MLTKSAAGTCATFDRAELTRAVTKISRIVDRRNTIPALSMVHIGGHRRGELWIRGTNLDLEMIVRLREADVHHRFEALVPAHKLLDVLRKAPECDQVAMAVDPHYGTIFKMGRLQISMNGQQPEDFPNLNINGDDGIAFELPTDVLLRCLTNTEYCISAEETRYYLNGVYVHVPACGKNAVLRFVATDGHRLAQEETKAPVGTVGRKEPLLQGAIIHSQTVHELIKLCREKDTTKEIGIRTFGTHWVITAGDTVLRSKLVDGSFPDYGRVIPLGNDKIVTAHRGDLLESLKAISSVASREGRAARLNIFGTRLTMSMNNPDVGLSKVDMEIDYAGEPIEIGFNYRYLQEHLEHIESDKVEVCLADPGSPTLIRGDRTGHLQVLMPMRV